MIDVAGELSPKLDLTAAVTNVTPALAKPFAPKLDATGVIALQAKLTGTTSSRPDGTVHFHRQVDAACAPAPAPPCRPPPLMRACRSRRRRSPDRCPSRCRPAGPSRAGRCRTHQQPPAQLDLRGARQHRPRRRQPRARRRRPAGRGQARPRHDRDRHAARPRPRRPGPPRQRRNPGLRPGAALLTDMAALITARGKTISIDDFVAHAGPGTINASGTVGALAARTAGRSAHHRAARRVRSPATC